MHSVPIQAAFLLILLGAGALSAVAQDTRAAARVFLAGDYIYTRALPSSVPEPFEKVMEISKSADVSIINMEHGYSRRGKPDPDYPVLLRGEPKHAAGLLQFGIDTVSLANNHTMNHGGEGLLETIAVLRRLGISGAGGGANLAAARSAALVPFAGRKIALLSYLSHTLTRFEIAGVDRPGLAFIRAFEVPRETEGILQVEVAPVMEDVERMKEDIARARSEATFVIVSIHFHWGRTQQPLVPHHQHFVSRQAVDAGADLVVGHGPHVLRPVELYRGKPIVYSIGNFVYSSAETANPESLESVFMELEFRAGEQTPSVHVTPIVIERTGPYVGLPRLAGEEEGSRILRRLRSLSEPYGTEVDSGPGRARVGPRR